MVSECNSQACSDSAGACIEHGATRTCLCVPGRAGPDCSVEKNPCEIANCHPEAHCIAKSRGEFDCDCPWGRHGAKCDKGNCLK